MRIGLIAVGAAFAIVGAGVIAAMALTEQGPAATRTGQVSVQQLAPSTNATILLHAVATGDGSANIAWNASAPAVVYWYAEAPCNPPPGWCFEGGALANWSGMLGGQWSWQGNVARLYCLYIVDKADRSVNITASFAESYPTSTHRLPLVPILCTMAGGSLLLGVGGMAVYLGVFLPAGVYSTPAAVPRDPNADPDPDYRFPPAR
ncbi:MAG: hypothetical protein WA766_06525 [Candidatus Acidiferrales bacterium]